MQKLQKGAANKKDLNIATLRKDFENQKSNLNTLLEKLKEFEGVNINSPPPSTKTKQKSPPYSIIIKRPSSGKKLNIAERKTLDEQGNKEDDINQLKKKLQEEQEQFQNKIKSVREEFNKEKKEEIEKLKQTQMKLMTEKVQLNALIEALKKENELRNKDSIKYKQINETYEKNEIVLKRSVKDLEYTIKLKNQKIQEISSKIGSENNDQKRKIFRNITKLSRESHE